MIAILVIGILSLMVGIVARNAGLRQQVEIQAMNSEIGLYCAGRMWEVKDIQPELGGYFIVTLGVIHTDYKPDGTSLHLFQEFPFRVGDCLVAYSDVDGDIELLKVGTVDEIHRAIPPKPLSDTSKSQESSPIAVEASPRGGER